MDAEVVDGEGRVASSTADRPSRPRRSRSPHATSAAEPAGEEDPANEAAGVKAAEEAARAWTSEAAGGRRSPGGCTPRARRVPRPRPPRAGRLRELPQARRARGGRRGRARQGRARARAAARGGQPRARARVGGRGGAPPRRGRGARALGADRGARAQRRRAVRPRAARRSTPPCTRRCPRATQEGAKPGVVLDVVEKGYRVERPGAPSRPRGGVRVGSDGSGEGPLQDARRRPQGVRRGDQEGLPQARAPVPPGPQPGRRRRRGALQGGPGGLLDPVRPREAARLRLGRRRVRRRLRPGRVPRRLRRRSGTSSPTSSGRGPAARPAPGPSAGATSRPTSTSPSTRR